MIVFFTKQFAYDDIMIKNNPTAERIRNSVIHRKKWKNERGKHKW